jgi:hypothetical protein
VLKIALPKLEEAMTRTLKVKGGVGGVEKQPVEEAGFLLLLEFTTMPSASMRTVPLKGRADGRFDTASAFRSTRRAL